MDSLDKDFCIAVVGLGYVGLPLAVSFSKYFKVIGFDISEKKIDSYKNGLDKNSEIDEDILSNSKVIFTSDESLLKEASFFIVSVPTPIDSDRNPDFTFLVSASEIIGKYLSKGSFVVYESTVYPGATEEICLPILEKSSGLICGEDFKIGYSPERVNPGDKVHTLENITKIVSSIDKDSLDFIASVYGKIISAGIYKAESIKIAEAAKVIENAQRDLNIAFMNELSIVFDKMNIDTYAVLEAASTKWNFLNFVPGLVGGHCIGVDPYYFIYKSEELDYSPNLISTAREINEYFVEFIVNSIVKNMVKLDKPIKGSNVLVLGISFKGNSKDIRNTKIFDLINNLKNLGVNVSVYDPIVNKEDVLDYYGIDLLDDYSTGTFDSVVLAVDHDIFKDLSITSLKKIMPENPILFDIKNILDKNEVIMEGIYYWTL